MNAAVISIGDELLIGQIANTNASWISEKLTGLGITVERIVTVPDSERDIISEFRKVFAEYDLLIVTGGLGPTHDDITKKCIAKFFKSKLVLNRKVLKYVESIFKRRKIVMPLSNLEQAMIPKTAEALPNLGTAPGLYIKRNKKMFFALPGVPYEMKYIFERSIVPHLKAVQNQSKQKHCMLHRIYHTIGVGESVLSELIGNTDELLKADSGSMLKLAFLPSTFEVRLRLSAESDSVKKAYKLLETAEKKLVKNAGRYIYSYDQSPIEKVTGELLRKKKLTLAVAESCTGGLVSSKLTDVPGSSDYLICSVLSYSNDSKIKLLGVRKATLKKHGAVSERTAIEMAAGVRRISGADIGISTTGIAGPAGATKAKPVGLVWIGYADRGKRFAEKFIFAKDRLINKEAMSKTAINIVRRQLLKL
jgi:nicotinamide-nucleotide amidase